MYEFDRVTDYVKAGPRRLADALELLEQPTCEPEAADAGHRNLRGAVYLAGYAVECALKAYIISRVPGASGFSEALQRRVQGGEVIDLGGRRAHNIRLLLRLTDLEGTLASDDALRRSLGLCMKWRPDWRYDPRPFTSRVDARSLLEASAHLSEWITRQRRSRD